MATYNLFFTGRDDPRNCVVIGEDAVPRFFCFETPERQINVTRTTVSNQSRNETRQTILSGGQVYSNTSSKVASLLFGPGNQLGSVTIGSRTVSMADLVSPGSSQK